MELITVADATDMLDQWIEAHPAPDTTTAPKSG
jgi:heptosyltransferase I